MNKRLFLWLVALLAIVSMQAAQLPPVHKTAETATWRLTLESYGSSRIAVIKVVKEYLGLSLGEATDLVDSAPCVLLENEEYDPAKWFYDDLVAAGATATLIDTDPAVAYTPPTYYGYGNVCTVILQDAGTQKLEVVKKVMELLGIGLRDAKDLVDDAPSVLWENIDYDTAMEYKAILEELGATIVIESTGSGEPDDPSGTWMTTLKNTTARTSLIALLKDELGISLSEAYDMTQNLPRVIKCGVTYEESIALTRLINNSTYGTAFTMRLEDGTMPSPKDATLSDVTISEAQVAWNKGDMEAKWMVRYGIAGEGETDNNLLTWDFEDGMQGWTTYDYDGDGFSWVHYVMNNYGYKTHSGRGVLFSESYSSDEDCALAPDNWLISPKLELGGVFKFWAVAQDDNYAYEHFAVYAVKGDDIFSGDIVYESDVFVATGDYQEYTIDLAGLSGEGLVAIRHFDCEDMFRLNIDDASYETKNHLYNSDNWQYALNLSETTCTLSGLKSGSPYVVQVMAVRDDCNNVSGWTTAGVIKTNDIKAPEDFYVFNVKQDRADLMWTPKSGEAKWNVRFWQEQEPFEDFESGELSDDWKIEDADGDGYSWAVYPNYGIHGANSLLCNDAYGDEWIVLPARYLEGILTFWAYTYSNGNYETNRGKFAVYVSTTNDDISSFVQVSPTWNWPESHQQFSVDLESLLYNEQYRDLYYGKQGYIAIHCYGGKGDNWLSIDDLAQLTYVYKEGEGYVEAWESRWGLNSTWYSLTDLELDTNYSVQVQGVLSSGERTPWTPVEQFKTWSDIVFMSDGNWNEADCWFNEEVPPTDANVIIAADCYIPEGYTAVAKGITQDVNGALILKEGAQLVYTPDDHARTSVGFERHFKANTYYYLRIPNKFHFPEEMLEGSYTLEYFNQSKGWTAISAKDLETKVSGGYAEYYNYRYRRSSDLTVILWGTPPASDVRIYAPLSITRGATYEGYNVVGNTYTCNSWLTYDDERTTLRPYWVMNEAGELVPGSGPIAPLQAVFVKVEGPDDTSTYFTTTEPQYSNKVTAPDQLAASSISGSSANISWGDHGGEVKWNVRYRKADNGTWTYWDFESGEQGWTNIDADGDGSKWYLGSSASSANTGYGYFYSSTYAGTDNWLISPKVDLGGILTVNALSAWSNYKEYFTVYVSRNNFDMESAQRASQTFEVAFNNNVYQPFTVDLSDIDASGKGYIFIRHQSEKTAGFLHVDDISYMTYPESGYIEPTEWKTVNNVSTMHYALKGLEPKTKYDVQVQAIYEGEGRISEWSDILQFTTGEGAATGVAEFEADGQSAHTYDLQGRAVKGKPARGVYIRNGQKVVSSK